MCDKRASQTRKILLPDASCVQLRCNSPIPGSRERAKLRREAMQEVAMHRDARNACISPKKQPVSAIFAGPDPVQVSYTSLYPWSKGCMPIDRPP